jgi:hypothetical protein
LYLTIITLIHVNELRSDTNVKKVKKMFDKNKKEDVEFTQLAGSGRDVDAIVKSELGTSIVMKMDLDDITKFLRPLVADFYWRNQLTDPMTRVREYIDETYTRWH